MIYYAVHPKIFYKLLSSGRVFGSYSETMSHELAYLPTLAIGKGHLKWVIFES